MYTEYSLFFSLFGKFLAYLCCNWSFVSANKFLNIYLLYEVQIRGISPILFCALFPFCISFSRISLCFLHERIRGLQVFQYTILYTLLSLTLYLLEYEVSIGVNYGGGEFSPPFWEGGVRQGHGKRWRRACQECSSAGHSCQVETGLPSRSRKRLSNRKTPSLASGIFAVNEEPAH